MTSPIQKMNTRAPGRYLGTNVCGVQLLLIGMELPPVIPVLFPNRYTIEDAVLQQLLSGEKLRQDNFPKSWRLAAYIYALRNKGWPITTRKIYRPEDKRYIAGYHLDLTAPVIIAVLGGKK